MTSADLCPRLVVYVYEMKATGKATVVSGPLVKIILSYYCSTPKYFASIHEIMRGSGIKKKLLITLCGVEVFEML